jgi:imidazolonepropionase
MLADRLWTNAHIATMCGPSPGAAEISAIASLNGQIAFVGAHSDAPDAREIIDCEGRWITPGLIDPHTHLVHAGSRADEFEQRLTGATYEQIALRGGGIISTVKATRAANLEELIASALPRLDAMIGQGITTIEIKSGYGLTLDDERKMLLAAKQLARIRPVDVVTTFLGAHAVPPEFAHRADAYVDEICRVMIPALVEDGLIDAVDVFCETIAFTREQAGRVLAAARSLGLPVKIHAEQLSNLGAAALAAAFGATSADHLEHLTSTDIEAMRAAGTVATLLPGAYYGTRETQLPPIAALRQAQVPIALATDCNPGTSPLVSPLLTMNLGATLFGLTVAECLLGFTSNAARALGRHDIGRLVPGARCDLAIWSVQTLNELIYWMGSQPLHARVFAGSPT